MQLVVDSCVIISGLVQSDSRHVEAKEFLHAAGERGDSLLTSATLLWDVTARFHHPEKAKNGLLLVDEYAVKLEYLNITEDLYRSTQGYAEAKSPPFVGIRSAIRGPDLVFVSCALATGAPLITFDETLRERAIAFDVAAYSPAEYVAGTEMKPSFHAPPEPRFMHVFERRFGSTNDRH